MKSRSVSVEFIPNPGDNKFQVSADPNPVPSDGLVESQDTVTFTAGPDAELQVGFESAYKLSDPSDIRPVGPLGPFESISHQQKNVIKGTMPQFSADAGDDVWRYVCIIFRNGERVPWLGSTGLTKDGGVNTQKPPLP
jgi:hypothetical protein